MVENILLWGSVAGYGAGTAAVVGRARSGPTTERVVLWSLFSGVLILALVITDRWLVVGYGPFLTMYEILLSNLFSLGLVYALLYWRFESIRPGAIVVMPILLVMSIWLLTTSPAPGKLPATFDNYWLWVHVGLGKVFLGLALAATGVAGALILTARTGYAELLSMRTVEELDLTAWRLMAAAFVFHSLMLIAGAAWANDAWGRYWAWDPLETWAFITWLVIGIGLHVRLTYKMPYWGGPLFIFSAFILAFLTFFGVPFFSFAPHKGVM